MSAPAVERSGGVLLVSSSQAAIPKPSVDVISPNARPLHFIRFIATLLYSLQRVNFGHPTIN
jgi:hypothetical protein